MEGTMTKSHLTHILRRTLFVFIGGLAFTAACGDEGRSDVGTATLALVQVPSDVSCISVTVVGSRTVTRQSDVMPGAASTLTLGGLPVGSDTFTGSAFSSSCAMVTASSVPTWAGGPVTATVTAVSSTPVTLTLQRNGRASVSIDFNDGTTCDATSCATGCCAGGMCLPGNTASACGTAGGACQQCAASQSCSSGTCTSASACDATTCPTGCCAGGMCLPGNSASACGAAGGACQQCPASQACSNGVCS